MYQACRADTKNEVTIRWPHFLSLAGIRIEIEHRGAVFIVQFADWTIHLFAPISREAQMQANPSLEPLISPRRGHVVRIPAYSTKRKADRLRAHCVRKLLWQLYVTMSTSSASLTLGTFPSRGRLEERPGQGLPLEGKLSAARLTDEVSFHASSMPSRLKRSAHTPSKFRLMSLLEYRTTVIPSWFSA